MKFWLSAIPIICGSFFEFASSFDITSNKPQQHGNMMVLSPTIPLNNGYKMPLLGLGTWKSEPGQVKAAVVSAIKAGYRHIDCASAYKNEKEVGEALAECLQQGVCTREDLFVVSKLWNNAHAPDAIIPALQESLADLALDYLDMYLMHWPVSLKPGVWFPQTASELLPFDLKTTWKGMERGVEAGLTRGIGVSNFSTRHLQELLQIATIKPAINQVECHPYLQQPKLLQFCEENNIHFTAYSPLGSLDRPASFKHANEPNLLEDPAIGEIAKRYEATPAQVLLKWHLQSGCSVIPKSVNPTRLVENLQSCSMQDLSRDDMACLAALEKHHRYVTGDFWCMEGSLYTLDYLWGEE